MMKCFNRQSFFANGRVIKSPGGIMELIKKQYIIDERNRKVAVLIDYASYVKMEELLENYGLYQFMQVNKDDQPLDRESALSYYQKLDKAK